MGRADKSKTDGADAGSGQALVAAMLAPAFYPEPPAKIIHKETHISHVFLAGDTVYKIKKPVRFSFLDFSTLAKRHHFLQEELRLNRRLAPSVYLGVMPISMDDGGWRLGGKGEPTDFVLVMRRLPEKRMLDFLLQAEQATAAMMEQLAVHLADFHATAEAVTDISSETHRSTVQSEWNDNLIELKPELAGAADRQALEVLGGFGADFFERNHDLLARRAAAGWIRDVHGDLHAEHICFAPEGLQIFDCIEFSAELRRCDLASEIAFLLMDLLVRGGEALVRPFLDRYLERIDDPDLKTLLPFYKCYRALVRAKVHALRLGRWNDEAARYFTFAQRMSWQRFQPFLVLVCGLTGSGKSTLARELSARLGMTAINSDEVRKRGAGEAGRQTAALNEGLYSEAMTEKTYEAMAVQAEKVVKNGRGVIADATFGRRSHREAFIRLADKHRIPLFVVRCSASDAETAQRLAKRAAQGTDISDGRWEVYVAQKAAYEPVDEVPAHRLLDLPADAPADRLLAETQDFLHAPLRSPSG